MVAGAVDWAAITWFKVSKIRPGRPGLFTELLWQGGDSRVLLRRLITNKFGFSSDYRHFETDKSLLLKQRRPGLLDEERP